jgi:hypothetical protein
MMRYSGQIRTLTENVVASARAIAEGRAPASAPLRNGSVEIRPVGRRVPIHGGDFEVDVDAPAASLSAFRMVVRTNIEDPCASLGDDVRDARREFDIARRDGVSERALDRLEEELLDRQRRLERCVQAAGHTTGTSGRDLPVFRSRDLLRTGNGETSVDGLQVYWRVLDESDRDAGVAAPPVITNGDLTVLAQAGVQPPIVVRRAHTENGLVRVDFHHEDHDVSGYLRIEVEPSSSRTFTRLVEMQLVDFDTDGVKGELGELLGLIGWRLENAVELMANRINAQLIQSFHELTDRGATITLLGVSELDDGLHLSYAAGILVNSPADPCQSFRDEIRVLEGQIHAAERDGVSERGIARLEAELVESRRALDRCEQTGTGSPPANTPGLPRPRPRPRPRPVPTPSVPRRPRPTPTRPGPGPDSPPRHEL